MTLNEEFFSKTSKEALQLHPRHETVVFDKGLWADKEIAETAGAYAYALNLPQIGGARPGQIGMLPSMDDGNFYPTNYPRTRDELKYRLNHDGLLFVGNVLPENDKEHVLAFFARDAGHPIHTEMVIARRDSNGLWSTHTSGGCGSPFRPSQTDFTSKPITDPLKADFCYFTNFLGYAIVPDEGILYYPRVKLKAETLGVLAYVQNAPSFGTP